MRMNETSIEKSLRETPQPEPPADLLLKLKEDLPPADRQGRPKKAFRRFLLRPLAIGGAVTLAVYLALGIYIYMNLPPKRYVEGNEVRAYLYPKKRWWHVFNRDLSAWPGGRADRGARPTVSTPALGEDIVKNLAATGATFRRIAAGLKAYQADHQNQAPETIEQLLKPVDYIGSAKDPFGTGDLKFVRQNDEVLIYSVGPDGKWDGGKPIDVKDPRLGGDVGMAVNLGTGKTRNLFDETWAPYFNDERRATRQ